MATDREVQFQFLSKEILSLKNVIDKDHRLQIQQLCASTDENGEEIRILMETMQDLQNMQMNELQTLRDRLVGLEKGLKEFQEMSAYMKIESTQLTAIQEKLDSLAAQHAPPVWHKVIADIHEAVVLGQGLFGTVYKGVCHGEAVAVKLLNNVEMVNVQKLQEEVAIHTEIQCIPGVVRLFGANFDGMKKYIVTELAHGSLHECIYDRKPSIDMSLVSKLKIAVQLTTAMRYVSDLGIIHRDLKPKNVLVFLHAKSEVKVKICDFGSAKHLHAKSLLGETAQGALKGSPKYMAPEVFEKNDFSVKSDVYAMAVLINELFTELQPFPEAINFFQVGKLVSVDRKRPHTVSLSSSAYAVRIVSLIESAWSCEPSMRCTFREMSERFTAVALGNRMGGIKPGKAPAVVGIDFGTTCTGVAFALYYDDGVVTPCSPRAIFRQTKESTVLLKVTQSRFGNDWFFGHEALEKFSTLQTEIVEESDNLENMSIFSGFKLQLLGCDDPQLLHVFPDNYSKPLPMRELVHMIYKKMKNFATSQIKVKCRSDGKAFVPEAHEILWVLTVPADMSERSKAFIKEAAFEAGLGRKRVELLSEPEAAAIALSDGSKDPLFAKGQRFILVDCGGGTVDITAHEVTEVNPLQLKPLAPKAGGNYGGEFVNMNIEKFIAELLGDLYLPKARPKAYHALRQQIESIKVATSEEPGNFSLIRAGLTTREERALVDQKVKTYQEEHPGDIRFYSNGQLGVSKQKFLSFFEPMITEICNAIRRVHSQCNIAVENVILTGGFADSKVLIDRINAEFSSGALQVRAPNLRISKQSAVAVGAVLFGMDSRRLC